MVEILYNGYVKIVQVNKERNVIIVLYLALQGIIYRGIIIQILVLFK